MTVLYQRLLYCLIRETEMGSFIVVALLLNIVVNTANLVQPQTAQSSATADWTSTARPKTLLNSTSSVKENVLKTDESAIQLVKLRTKFDKQNELTSAGEFVKQSNTPTPGDQNELTTAGEFVKQSNMPTPGDQNELTTAGEFVKQSLSLIHI